MLKRGEKEWEGSRPRSRYAGRVWGRLGLPNWSWHFGEYVDLSWGCAEEWRKQKLCFHPPSKNTLHLVRCGWDHIHPTNPLKQWVSKCVCYGCLVWGLAAMRNARLCLAFSLHIAEVHIPCCPGFRPRNPSFESAMLFSALSSFYSHQK